MSIRFEIGEIKLDIEDVAGIDSTLNTESNVSLQRKFQIRQQGNESAPFALANLVFYQYIMQYEPHYHGIPFKSIKFKEDPEKAGEIYDGEVEYAFDAAKDTDNSGENGEEQEFTLPTFSMMGGKRKQVLPVIMYNANNEPINQVLRYKKAGDSRPPVDYKMIGWDGKQFNGVEIETPDLQFMVPAWYPARVVKFEFIRRLMQYIGKVNKFPFYGLFGGECKYLGPEQSWVTRTIETQNPDSPVQIVRFVELQHHFQVQLEMKDLKIGEIDVPYVSGWDYIDVHYENSLVDIGEEKKVPLAVPAQVDIVPVYERTDLWDLFNGKIMEGL